MALKGPVRPETRLPLAAWHDFFDTLGDAVLLFDSRAQVAFANIAALRLVPGALGQPVAQLHAALGTAAGEWLQAALTGRPRAAEPDRKSVV